MYTYRTVGTVFIKYGSSHKSSSFVFSIYLFVRYLKSERSSITTGNSLDFTEFGVKLFFVSIDWMIAPTPFIFFRKYRLSLGSVCQMKWKPQFVIPFFSSSENLANKKNRYHYEYTIFGLLSLQLVRRVCNTMQFYLKIWQTGFYGIEKFINGLSFLAIGRLCLHRAQACTP